MPKAKAPVLFPFHPITGSLYCEEPFSSQGPGYWNDGRNHDNHAHWANDYDVNIEWARQRGNFEAAFKLEAEKNAGLLSGELTFSPVKAIMRPYAVITARMRFVEAPGPGKGSAVLVLEDSQTKSRYPMLVAEANDLLSFGIIDHGNITNIQFWGPVKTNHRYGIKAVG